MVLFPRVAGERGKVAERSIRRALRANLLVSSTGALLLALGSPFLLPLLFGVEFSDAVLPAIILLVAIVILGFNYVLSDGLRGMGHPGSTSIAEFTGTVVTIAGLVVLLPRFGIYGAALTSVLSYLSVAAILYVAFHRYVRLPAADFGESNESLDSLA